MACAVLNPFGRDARELEDDFLCECGDPDCDGVHSTVEEYDVAVEEDLCR